MYMNSDLEVPGIAELASSGHYLALRVGFAFPMEEVNAFPAAWVEYYTRQGFMLEDPVIRWIYQNTGSIRWSEIELLDQRDVMRQAARFGLVYGAAVCCFDHGTPGQRSFGSFARADREFTEPEISVLSRHVNRLHREKAPPKNLTRAELETLHMVKSGMRLKQIAHELSISEGAVKQRLRSGKDKLGAATSAQAASLASDFGLI